MHLERARLVIGSVAVAGTLAVTGCSTAVSSGSGAGGVSGNAAAAPTTTSTPSTTSIALAPTTTEATPTDATTATEVTTTTAAPTTTAARFALASNIVAVPPASAPLQAVGGGSGQETARIQARLLELGFWLDGVDGSYGLTTTQAVMAFEKYMGFDADGRVDQQTADALGAMTQRPIGRADAGTLIEIDKAKQLLYFVIDGKTEWILNTSTGSEEPYSKPNRRVPGEVASGDSVTPSGLHRVNRERPDGWWEGDLGRIYRPKYFVGGVAVHGSDSIPNYPASHGCVRVSVPAMDWIWESGILPLRTPVWVHDGV